MSKSLAKSAGMPIIDDKAAGIDIGARFHVAAVPPDLCSNPVQTFQAFTADLERMADWLVSLGIRTVAMESTGVYWIPVYEVLEDRGIAVIVANARESRAVPGRKSDVNDAQWLQRLHACGLLRASFRPGRDIAAQLSLSAFEGTSSRLRRSTHSAHAEGADLHELAAASRGYRCHWRHRHEDYPGDRRRRT